MILIHCLWHAGSWNSCKLRSVQVFPFLLEPSLEPKSFWSKFQVSDDYALLALMYKMSFCGCMLIGKWLFLLQNDVMHSVLESLPWSSSRWCSSHGPHLPHFCNSLYLTNLFSGVPPAPLQSLQPCPGQLRTWMVSSLLSTPDCWTSGCFKIFM